MQKIENYLSNIRWFARYAPLAGQNPTGIGARLGMKHKGVLIRPITGINYYASQGKDIGMLPDVARLFKTVDFPQHSI